MKVKLTLLTALFLAPAVLSAMTGRQIMEKNDALPEAKTNQGSSVLVIIKGSMKEVKYFNLLGKKYGETTRSRITFTKPTKIEFLTWSEPGEDSLQWLKLSSGTVRKIASSDKGSSFVNSHFYYEDIGVRDIDDYNYKKLSDAKVDGVDCYRVESIKKKGTKVYSKGIIYLRKSDFVAVQIDFYEGGQHTKTLQNQKIEVIQGIYTPRKVEMTKFKNGKAIGKSLLYLKSVKYNIGVNDALLLKDAL